MTVPDGDLLTDEQVGAAVGGSIEARDAVLRVLARRIPAMVSVRLSPSAAQHHVVEDLSQEVLVSISEGLARMREPTAIALKSMTSVITARRVADYLRTAKGGDRPAVRSLDTSLKGATTTVFMRDLIPASSLSPRSAAIRAEGVRQTLGELSRLKDEYRDVITLAFFDQLPMAEVADRLSMSRGAASMLLMRAIHALRESVGRVAAL